TIVDDSSDLVALREDLADSTKTRQASGPQPLSDSKPPARVIAAVYQLKLEGRPISLRAACERAGVDRKHLRARYPETAIMIQQLAKATRTPRRGKRDARTGALHAVDEPED